MDTRKIRKLIDIVKETGIGELEVKSGEDSVRINCQTNLSNSQTISTTVVPTSPLEATEPKAAQPEAKSQETAAPQSEKTAQANGHTVHSPMVGTVYLASTPGSPPLVSVGQHVNVGDTLCLIEAMKMFNKIEADRAGTISARMVENEQPVEYDQALFIIDTGE